MSIVEAEAQNEDTVEENEADLDLTKVVEVATTESEMEVVTTI